MRRNHGLVSAIAVLTAVLCSPFQGPVPVEGQSTAEEILQTAVNRYQQRMEGIQDYTVVQSTNGAETIAFFQRVEGGDGSLPVFRPATSLDLSSKGSEATANPFLKQGGVEMATGMSDPSGLFKEIGHRARLLGIETVGGREAYVIAVEDLTGVDFGGTMGTNDSDADFQPASLRLWLDQDRYVTLRTTLTGTLDMEGETSELTMDARMGEYREVGGMLHPFRTEVSLEGMAGALTSEQQAQLSEAQRQLQEQMEQMDEAQRAMVERMMEDRMPDLEGMAGSGPTTFTTEVEELRVNEGPPPEMAGQTRMMDRLRSPQDHVSRESRDEPTGIPPQELTPEYMEGEWCTRGWEPAIYRFYEDGSHHMALAEQLRVDTSGSPRSYESFIQRLEGDEYRILEKTEDQFTVMWRDREIRWLRDCEGGGQPL